MRIWQISDPSSFTQVSKRGYTGVLSFFSAGVQWDGRKEKKSIDNIQFMTSMGYKKEYTIAGSRIGNVSMKPSPGLGHVSF